MKILAIVLGFVFLAGVAHAEPVRLTASWYSIASLKKEGTFKYSKGVMANGELFSDTEYTAASRMYPLGSFVSVTNIANGKSVKVRITDRIGKRFAATRIDLSAGAFGRIANHKSGVIQVLVERIA